EEENPMTQLIDKPQAGDDKPQAEDGATAATGASTFPGSRKVYQQGSRDDLRVPAREVALAPTSGRFGEEENAPLRVYATSGPYTDPEAAIDIRQGLLPLRRHWILERGDVEEYDGREIRPQDDGLRADDPRANREVFPGLRRRPLRARP